jgi:hypothetical protein
MARPGTHDALQEDSLFFSLAEDLKTPLLRIAYQAELSDSEAIRSTALDALKLLDAYLLSTSSQAAFALEPVSPAAVLVDAAHDLSPFAKKFDCQVELDTHMSHATALLHRQGLLAALTAIGKVFIEAHGILGGKGSVALSAYKSKNGVAVGIFQTEGSSLISAQLLSRARSHVGSAARPFAGLASGAAAQLFVAERLLQGMHTSLRTARRGTRSGLAADLLPSNQLNLV